MSVETISPAPAPKVGAPCVGASRAAGTRAGGARRAVPRSGGAVRPVAGVLADGTVHYAPIGEVLVVDDTLVTCHLCGRSLRSVTAHLRAHGWTKEAYCEAFGLERGQSLEGPQTRKLRAAALAPPLVFAPAIREGSAAGRDRARAGALARDAAAAARGRPLPEQRLRKARGALAAIPPARVAEANSERARRRRARVAAEAARRAGYPDIRALVLERAGQGASLAAMSREAGLHKDWRSRHPRSGRGRAATARRPVGCPVAPGAHQARIHRRGRVPARTPHRAASHDQRDRRRGRAVASCRALRAAPSPAGPDGARREAACG